MPECYRESIGKRYLALLEAGKSPKEAMHATRQQFKGRGGKPIGRNTVYRCVDFVKALVVAAARKKRR